MKGLGKRVRPSKPRVKGGAMPRKMSPVKSVAGHQAKMADILKKLM